MQEFLINDDIEMINEILNRISKRLIHWYKNALSKNELPSQQMIRCIKQLIDNFMLPYRSFESKKPNSRSKFPI